jgi:hypothetical protein
MLGAILSIFDIAYVVSTNITSIIAVYGLNQYSKGNRDQGHLWHRDYLAQEPPGLRVFLYYNEAEVKINTFGDKANELLEDIRILREDDVESRPILFLGHGLGELLIKHALINACNNQTYTSIANSTSGLAFFAINPIVSPPSSMFANIKKIVSLPKVTEDTDLFEQLRSILQGDWVTMAQKYEKDLFLGSHDKVCPGL